MEGGKQLGWNGDRQACDGEIARRMHTSPWHPHWLKPRPIVPGGARCWSGLLAVLLAAAGPDEGEGLAVWVVEEVGVDRSGEARIVQLDREVVAALVGALRPGGSDLGSADEDPMAGSVVVGPVGLRDDAHALCLDAQGSD